MLFFSIIKKVKPMNTSNNDLTIAVIAALVAAKPALKVDDSLTTALQSAIDKVLPSQALSESVRLDFDKALSAKGLLHDTFKTGLVHVPDSQLQSKTGSHAQLIPAHDVTIDLPVTLDTVYRLATQVINLTTRLMPSDCNESLHLPAIGLIGLDTILGKVNASASNSTGKPEKDYISIMAVMGLSDFIAHMHPEFTSGVNYQHADDNSAITLHVANLASVKDLLVKTSKKGAFTYTTDKVKYDVVVSSTLDDDFIPVIKLRFTKTTA